MIRYVCISILTLVLYNVSGQGINKGNSFALEQPFGQQAIDIGIDSVSILFFNRHDIVLVYSSAIIAPETKLSIAASDKIIDVLESISRQNDASFEEASGRITFVSKAPPKKIVLNGYVFDHATNETLSGVIVESSDGTNYTFTNESGYFSITMPLDEVLYFSHLGYDTYTMQDFNENKAAIYLKENTTFQTIEINEQKSAVKDVSSGSVIIGSDLWNQSQQELMTSGVKELVERQPFVTHQGEGQGELNVKGGGHDQNLILIDNMHIYEMNHAFGLNSIFITPTLKQLDLASIGMPARYGDRLSSVLSATLKDGDPDEHHKFVDVSLTNAVFQADGPLTAKGNSTYNIGLRQSLYNLYLPQVLRNFTKYENSSLGYRDLFLKFRHRPMKTLNISGTAYIGTDNLYLNSLEPFLGEELSLDLKSSLKWYNHLWVINYDQVVGSKLHLHMDVGGLRYGQEMSSEYDFIENIFPDNYFKVSIASQIKDFKYHVHMDYYSGSRHKLQLGYQYLNQAMAPSILQYLKEYTDQGGSVPEEYKCNTHSFYIEDIYSPLKNLQVYAGLRFSRFEFGSRFDAWQPRLKAEYALDNPRLNVSVGYSESTQFAHLLSNTGLGLPSDIWVPSTEDLLPESSRNIEAAITYAFNDHISLNGMYYKRWLSNVVDYKDFVHLFILDVFQNDASIYFDEESKWEDGISQGNSEVNGFSTGLTATYAPWSTTIQFSHNIGNVTIKDINDGLAFPSRYDTPIDINHNLIYKFSPKWSVESNYIYTSGSAFTLGLEEYETVLGITRLAASGRNNFRLPAYSRLNLRFNYERPYANGHLYVSFGAKNILNRKNAFYIYLINDPSSNRTILRKVSLVPIHPTLSVKYRW